MSEYNSRSPDLNNSYKNLIALSSLLLTEQHQHKHVIQEGIARQYKIY